MVRAFAVNAVVYRLENRKPKFLILQKKEGHWSFIGGGPLKGESAKKTLEREAMDEAQIDSFEIIPRFKHRMEFSYRYQSITVFKEVDVYLLKTKQKKIKISPEHQAFKWMDYAKARNQLTHENSKIALDKAFNRLKKR